MTKKVERWRCFSCGKENNDSRKTCVVCGSPRPIDGSVEAFHTQLDEGFKNPDE